MPVTVTAIATTPVKGLALHAPDAVELGRDGVWDNRRFYLVDDSHTLVNNKRVGELMAVRADLDADGETLSLHFPDGGRLSERISDGPTIETSFFSRSDRVHPVCPELSRALSDYAGRELSLVRAVPELTACDRGHEGVVSLFSRGSLERLGTEAGAPVDARRFRMLFEVDGLDAHGEDAWVGAEVQIGGARVRFHGHVGRCRVTQMDPDTGAVDLETLGLLGYRTRVATTEPLALGIYGEVTTPGVVRVGDPVTAASASSCSSPEMTGSRRS